MKFMIPFLISILPVASIAQSPSGVASGVPSVAIPKTTEVLVIQAPKQGRYRSTNLGRHTGRDSGDCEALPRRENPPVVFAR